jgi:hypothetical protein
MLKYHICIAQASHYLKKNVYYCGIKISTVYYQVSSLMNKKAQFKSSTEGVLKYTLIVLCWEILSVEKLVIIFVKVFSL